ncbi:hypothetical protein C0J52_22104 [Blattella germanica]|nr:hypothetical protein C0J52_22104 [Blattella germanica]
MKSLDIIQLSCYLGEQGFLTLIPVISSWSSRSHRNCNQLHYVCMSLLGELLVSMSESVLGASQLWPGGTKAFREHLIVGLWHLPSDYTDWLNLLGATHATEPSQHTIIVLSFFSCACASR